MVRLCLQEFLGDELQHEKGPFALVASALISIVSARRRQRRMERLRPAERNEPHDDRMTIRHDSPARFIMCSPLRRRSQC
jgi:hypothetical protein